MIKIAVKIKRGGILWFQYAAIDLVTSEMKVIESLYDEIERVDQDTSITIEILGRM